MTISKIFTQKYVSFDCEARRWTWVDTDKDYDALAEELRTKWDGWFDGVRLVKKTFDDETFMITVEPIKQTDRHYTHGSWDGAKEFVCIGEKEVIG